MILALLFFAKSKFYCNFTKMPSLFVAIGSDLECVPKPEKKSAQSFYKFVIERGNYRRSVIYGFSNGFYRWNTLVGVPTLRFGTDS